MCVAVAPALFKLTLIKPPRLNEPWSASIEVSKREAGTTEKCLPNSLYGLEVKSSFKPPATVIGKLVSHLAGGN